MRMLAASILAALIIAPGAKAQSQTVNFWLSLQGSATPVTDVSLYQGQTVDLSLWYQTDDAFAHNTLEVLVGYDSANAKGTSATPMDGFVELAGPPSVNTDVFDQVLVSDVGGGYKASSGTRAYGAHLVLAKVAGSVTATSPKRIADLTIRNASVPGGYSYLVSIYNAGSGANWTSAIAQDPATRRDPTPAYLLIQSVSVSPISIPDAKALPDGTYVSCVSDTVTAVFGSGFYIQEPDRRSGIRVTKQEHGAREGNTVDVTGVLSTDPMTGERFIDAANGTVRIKEL